MPHAASGAVRLLAVSSEHRLAALPDVPTVSEAGYPGFKALTWNGLVAPAGTPADVVSRIAGEVARAARDPEAHRAPRRLRGRPGWQPAGRVFRHDHDRFGALRRGEQNR